MNRPEMRIFVVDDEIAVRTAMQTTLQGAGIHADVFASAEACLAALSRQACDVVITDLRLAGMNGLSLLQELRRRFPWLQTLVATAYGDVRSAVAAMRLGVADFLEKPLDRQELLSAVDRLRQAARPVPYPREALSLVEARVLGLFLDGLTAKQTAEILNRSRRTVETHRRHLLRKFGVHNAAQLAQKAETLWVSESRTSTMVPNQSWPA